MTGAARIVVMGTGASAPPPGIHVIEDVVDLVFATTVDEVTSALEGADVLLAWRAKRDLLEPAWPSADALKWIQASSAGVDGLLFPQLVESHVVLTNARGVFDDAVAEYTIGLLLLFAKDLVGVLDLQRVGEWHGRDTEMLVGKRLLVVGVGPIGRAIARLAGPFGLQVRGVGRRARPGDAAFGTILGPEDLLDALAWADYVVDALPATPDTRHRFDEAAFRAMTPDTRFVNVGRGSTVDEAALVRALAEGRLAAAALDVFEDEPLPADSPLWAMPNVVVSPHMSADFAGWREAVVELFVENLERYLTGRPLKNVVDKSLGFVP